MTTTVVNNLVFRSFFEKQKLTGPNFMDWYCNLRIVLSVEDKLPFLEQPIPAMPVPPAGQVLPPDVLNTHSAWVKVLKEIDAPPFAAKPKNPPTPKKDNPTKDAICHQCGEVGHWRRNCLVYLTELLKKKKLSQGASTLDTSLNHEEDDQEIDEPQSDINLIRKSSRTSRAPDRMCLHVDAEEHELGDLGEPANYKAILLDPESNKWLNAMNVEMQSMKDNKFWDLVDLSPDGKTVGSK
ncbi:retrotransposon protein, putative, ty1-copia subclass [Tanacetum coccineum]